MPDMSGVPHHVCEDTPSLPALPKKKNELPLTFSERRELAMEVIDHLNFFPKVFENKHAFVAGLIIHQLTDPRVQKPLPLRRGTRVVGAIKKNVPLWEKLKPFLVLDLGWRTIYCKCSHTKGEHTSRKGRCKGSRGWGSSAKACKCDHFRGKEL